MNIAIDATGLSGVKAGTAVYLLEILRIWNQDKTLRHHFVIFVSPKAEAHFRELALDTRFTLHPAPDGRALRILWQQLCLPWQLRRHRIDVHWGAGFILPLLSRRPMVVTIHDLTFQLFPAVHEPVKRYYFPIMIDAAVRKARRIIAISETTRDDLHRLLPASRGKTAVTLLAPRPYPAISDDPGQQPRPGSYLLSLGTLEPRKNLARLVDAWLAIPVEEKKGCKLIVVGMQGWMLDRWLGTRRDIDPTLEFAGYLDDAALHRLLRHARALAYPSLYEGFGLPVIEAMSLGVPVLTSNRGATREIADAAALLVDPTDVGAIEEALRQLLVDDELCRRLSAFGRARANAFSWKKTAGQTLRALETVKGNN